MLATNTDRTARLLTRYDSSKDSRHARRRPSAIQGFSPLKGSIAFVLINGIRPIRDLRMATPSAASMSVAPITLPLALVDIGFAFAISAVNAVAVNSVPNQARPARPLALPACCETSDSRSARRS